MQDLTDATNYQPALVLVKSLERLYRTCPQFTDLAKQQDFIEALAATLFAPVKHERVGMEELEGDLQQNECDDDGVSTIVAFSTTYTSSFGEQ